MVQEINEEFQLVDEKTILEDVLDIEVNPCNQSVSLILVLNN